MKHISKNSIRVPTRVFDHRDCANGKKGNDPEWDSGSALRLEGLPPALWYFQSAIAPKIASARITIASVRVRSKAGEPCRASMSTGWLASLVGYLPCARESVAEKLAKPKFA